MFKKRYATLTVTLVMALTLAACSESVDNQQDQPSTTEHVEAGAVQPSAESAVMTATEIDSKDSAANRDALKAGDITVQRVNPAPSLYEIVYSPKQHAVFVASAGLENNEAVQSKILRLNPETLTVEAEIPLALQGYGLALDDEAERLYVGNSRDMAITVVDTAENKVLDSLQLVEKVADAEGKLNYPHHIRQLVIDKAHNRLFAPGLWFNDSALYVIQLDPLKVEEVLPGFGFVTAGNKLNSKQNALYISNLQGQLYTVDSDALTIVSKQEVDIDQPLNIDINTESGDLLITDQGLTMIDNMRETMGGLHYQNRSTGNSLVVLNPNTGEVQQRVAVAKGPIAVQFDEARHRIYVTSREGGVLTVIDSRDYSVVHEIEVASYPNSIAINRATGDAYITVKNKEDQSTHNESVVKVSIP